MLANTNGTAESSSNTTASMEHAQSRFTRIQERRMSVLTTNQRPSEPLAANETNPMMPLMVPL